MAKEPDPREVWSSFERELNASKGLPPAVIVRGAEAWYRTRAVDLLVERARAAEYELCRHDTRSPDFRAAALLDDLASTAMFASARCVVLGEPEALLKKQGGEESPTARALLAFVKRGAGALVLSADSLRADLSVVKALGELGARTYSFRKLYEKPSPWERDPDPARAELVSWVQSRARERKVAVTSDQALLLAHARGNDLAALDDELAAAAGAGGKFSLAGLASAAAGSPRDLADALIGGDLGAAALAAETLFRGGIRREKDGSRDTDEGALTAILLGYLRPRVRQGLAAAQHLERGAKPDEAASEAGVTGFDKVLRGAIAARPPAAWSAMLDDLLALERHSKSARGVDASEFAALALKWRVKRR
ncbi:MAG: hypothetical protein JNN27_05365 [Planctomycetes bacterium]|jgi:DNA polymerase III delta subunit|nr:hypothetical protein [Planctomycetota bacterium]